MRLVATVGMLEVALAVEIEGWWAVASPDMAFAAAVGAQAAVATAAVAGDMVEVEGRAGGG